VDTEITLKTVSDPIQGTTLTLAADLSTITHASGAKYEFVRSTSYSPAGNQAAEGFAATDMAGTSIQKGDWKGWEPVTYNTSTYLIGESRKTINQIKVTSTTPGEGGQRIEFIRKTPTPTGYNSSAQTINSWAGTDTQMRTEIRFYPNPEITDGEACRFNRLIHAEPGTSYGSPTQA
jgi:hypothetical protein